MKTIPPALASLAAHKQFIMWGTYERDGKLIKLPVSTTGEAIDAHDPTKWLTADQALANCAATGNGVGFVLTDQDPFFFLDIDHCRQGDAWSPLAHSLIGALPGAAVEVSQSGNGLHVIGSGVAPSHKCKNVRLGLELYTSKRFIALTGINAVGDAGVDLTPQLQQIVPQYFPTGTPDGQPVEWTSEPAAGWNGPEDDDELLRRALRSKSAGTVFGNRASFADLWTGDEDALATAYPDTGARPYDESSADAALAQHLAFWTGGNCDRMFALMWRSGLVRDKWTNRDDYLNRTVLGAAARQTEYYAEKVPVEEAAPPMAAEAPTVVSGYQYLGADAQIDHFKGCVYVQNVHRILTPFGTLLKPEQFNATYGGYVFQVDETGDKTTRKAWEAFTESQLVKYPRAEGTCFRPELAPGEIIEQENSRLVNTYVPVATPRVAGDPTPFLTHLYKLLPDPIDREILLAYLAAVVQHKGVKFQWAPLLQGVPGNGKTLFSRCVAAAVGHRYTHLPNAKDIDNRFNAWLLNKIFIGVEDIYVPDHKSEVIEAIKPMITNDRLEFQPKGTDQFTGDNRANFILNSNRKDAIRKTKSDRRFAVFFTAQQDADDLARDGLDGEYFPNLYDWLRGGGYAIVTNFLYEYQIPSHLNPATHCHRAPRTSSTDAAIYESMGSVEQEVVDAIDEGKRGFAGGWVSSMALDRLLETLRMTRAIPRNKRRELLQALGYDWHPALPGGRVGTHIMEEGGKPKLFIKHGHPALSLTKQSDVILAYLEAQKGDDAKAVDGLLSSV